jgi:hypothetical protein
MFTPVGQLPHYISKENRRTKEETASTYHRKRPGLMHIRDPEDMNTTRGMSMSHQKKGKAWSLE